MPVNLSIKDVPDALAQALRERAARNHRSLQGELLSIVEAAVAAPARVPSVTPAVGEAWIQAGTVSFEEMVEEHRLRFPHPVNSGPPAVDIIRADRDSQ